MKVVHLPRSGDATGLFVVEKETVERALMTGYWSPGVRVKLAIEVTDSVRAAMYQGTVSKVLSKPFPWLGSPWRAIQVHSMSLFEYVFVMSVECLFRIWNCV